MSTSLPSQFAIALGLAALGRKIILVRENNETTEKRRAAMFAELMDRGYEWLQYDRTRDVVRCDNNEGCVMFVSPSEPLERFGGLESKGGARGGGGNKAQVHRRFFSQLGGAGDAKF